MEQLLTRRTLEFAPNTSYLWRVTSSESRPERPYKEGILDLDRALDRWYISSHLMGQNYYPPCQITSLTTSLLWALNYAHYLLSRGFQDVQIILINGFKLSTSHGYPATTLVKFLDVQKNRRHWHDDPYHEYLVFGGIPERAIVSTVNFDNELVSMINNLLPGFDQFDASEFLYSSLCRLSLSWRD